MAVLLSPFAGVGAQLLDNNGNILAGGKIYTYAAGTNTPATVYTNSSGVIPHSNPIILDASGRVPGGEIWLVDGQSYKFVVQDAYNNLIATYDNIVGINSNFLAYTSQQEIQTATAGQTVFTLTTMTYLPNTNNLAVYVDGVNQYGPGSQYAYVETSSNVVTFENGLHVGALVKFTSATPVSASQNAANIPYDPPFTGGVQETVAAKLSQYVSVKDFGAVGDGTTDDTAAIQLALNTNHSIYFPIGTYRTTSQLNITHSGTKLMGESLQNTIIHGDFAGIVIGRPLTDFPISNAYTRIQIENLYIQTTQINSKGIDFSGFSFSRFVNLIVELGADNNYGLYGVAPQGVGPYYNEFYQIDVVYGGTTVGFPNYTCGMYFGNDRSVPYSNNPLNPLYYPIRRSPNANHVYGGRIQGCQVAVADISGVTNSYLAQTLEGNQQGYLFGADAVDTTNIYGQTDGVTINWVVGSEGPTAKSLYSYLEANKGVSVWYKETAKDCAVIVGYLTAAIGGTPVQLDNINNLYWIPGDTGAGYGSTNFGGKITFAEALKFASGDIMLASPAGVRPTFFIDDTANVSGKLIEVQNYGSINSLKTFRLYNLTDGNEMLNVSSTGVVIAPAGLGVGNSAAATTLGSVVKKMQVFAADGTSLGYVPIYNSIT